MVVGVGRVLSLLCHAEVRVSSLGRWVDTPTLGEGRREGEGGWRWEL